MTGASHDNKKKPAMWCSCDRARIMVTVAESRTGGMVAAALTDIAGASCLTAVSSPTAMRQNQTFLASRKAHWSRMARYQVKQRQKWLPAR